MAREGQTPVEKDLEIALCSKIRLGASATRAIQISTPSKMYTLFDLLEDTAPIILQDHSDWNNHKYLSADLFGGITPDIVLRSPLSGENRIIIEVKNTAPFGHAELDASQVLRYFLHLLTTTNRKFKAKEDMPRAVLLAAPSEWFESTCAIPWKHFLKQYNPLASQFNILLGGIILDPAA